MGTWNCLMTLLLALPSVLSLPSEHQGMTLYPFGEAQGDMITEIEDDGGYGPLDLPNPITFYGKRFHDIYVNNNGVCSFESPVTDYTPEVFPIAGLYMICPFWSDVDNEKKGDVFFRITRDPSILKRLTNEIRTYFGYSTFETEWSFIVTWDNVAYHGSESDKTNTFQMVLAVDGGRCFVMFLYHHIQWTTGTASGGDPKTGTGGHAAQLGFNADNRFFNMALSRTPEVINVIYTSNVGIPGCWVFRVDEFKVPGGCMYLDSFLNFGQFIWSDQSCSKKCSCRHDGQVHCEEKPCDEGQVCVPAGRHHMCQIKEVDC